MATHRRWPLSHEYRKMMQEHKPVRLIVGAPGRTPKARTPAVSFQLKFLEAVTKRRLDLAYPPRLLTDRRFEEPRQGYRASPHSSIS